MSSDYENSIKRKMNLMLFLLGSTFLIVATMGYFMFAKHKQNDQKDELIMHNIETYANFIEEHKKFRDKLNAELEKDEEKDSARIDRIVQMIKNEKPKLDETKLYRPDSVANLFKGYEPN